MGEGWDVDGWVHRTPPLQVELSLYHNSPIPTQAPPVTIMHEIPRYQNSLAQDSLSLEISGSIQLISGSFQ